MSTEALVKYDSVARILHWIIGIGIIVALYLGLNHDAWKAQPGMAGLHKAVGITILFLSLLRLYWRLTHTPPPLPASTPRLQAFIARGLHILFYVMMIGVPLSGWIMSSAGPYPISWFGLFDVPKFAIGKDSPLAEAAHEGHEIMGTLFLPLLVLHVAAGFYHQFRMKDQVLQRML